MEMTFTNPRSDSFVFCSSFSINIVITFWYMGKWTYISRRSRKTLISLTLALPYHHKWVLFTISCLSLEWPNMFCDFSYFNTCFFQASEREIIFSINSYFIFFHRFCQITCVPKFGINFICLLLLKKNRMEYWGFWLM